MNRAHPVLKTIVIAGTAIMAANTVANIGLHVARHTAGSFVGLGYYALGTAMSGLALVAKPAPMTYIEMMEEEDIPAAAGVN